MSFEVIGAVAIGGGQAELVVRHHLSEREVPHLILNLYRIEECWRTEQ